MRKAHAAFWIGACIEPYMCNNEQEDVTREMQM